MSELNNRVFAAAAAYLLDRTKRDGAPSSESMWRKWKHHRTQSPPLLQNHNHSGENASADDETRLGRLVLRWALRAVGYAMLAVVIFFALFYAACYPPLYWFYEIGPPAGPGSVYVPGGGVSGFWFHLGYLDAFAKSHDLHDHDFYCFSAGCLSVLSAFLNRSLEDVHGMARDTQTIWRSGNMSRFEVVGHFFDELYPPEWEARYEETNFLPRLKILVTTLSSEDPAGGYRVREPTTRAELRAHILQTTWVPYIIGWGWHPTERPDDRVVLDGGVSRLLHPPCEVRWDLPLVWETLVHSFSLGLSRESTHGLWELGRSFAYEPPASTRDGTAIERRVEGNEIRPRRSPPANGTAARPEIRLSGDDTAGERHGSAPSSTQCSLEREVL